MAWRVAYSLDKLLTQLNAMAPWRSKVSDGGIGDAVHATRDSDHNPWFVLKGQPLVTARDFTHDPANGLDCHWLAETLVASKDSRIKYIIWNKRIVQGVGPTPWKWFPYTGPNPHTKHLHLSVKDNATADDTRMWALTPHLPLDDDMALTEADVVKIFWGVLFDRQQNYASYLKDRMFTAAELRAMIREEMAKTVNVKVTVDGE